MLYNALFFFTSTLFGYLTLFWKNVFTRQLDFFLHVIEIFNKLNMLCLENIRFLWDSPPFHNISLGLQVYYQINIFKLYNHFKY